MGEGIFEKKKILIWGKTYPELSTKHLETVCTGGVFEDGQPVRLYPIPFRYLNGDDQFKKYQWVTVYVKRNLSDFRPESYKIDVRQNIDCGEVIPPTKDEWGKRADELFKFDGWQFGSVDELQAAQKAHHTSLGVLTPREILDIRLVARSDQDKQTFSEKMARIKAIDNQPFLFEDMLPPELKHIEYIESRIRIDWKCHEPNCNVHKMQILDWEVLELQRKTSHEKALAKVKEVCDLTTHATRFFLGNIHQHPMAFTIVGLWYPKRELAPRLF